MSENLKVAQNEAEYRMIFYIPVKKHTSSALRILLCLLRRSFPYMPMQWMSSELFDPSVSKESVEALGTTLEQLTQNRTYLIMFYPRVLWPVLSKDNHLRSEFAWALRLGLHYPCMLAIVLLEDSLIKKKDPSNSNRASGAIFTLADRISLKTANLRSSV
ncbi:hypothetical protein ACH5RR_023215 [Cinchona calisaya]|uniref:Uncharacterized protein n=1 Tax=Cinchona calisaya TaxID=153742 RepID=A0ABD2ZA27_9GENT